MIPLLPLVFSLLGSWQRILIYAVVALSLTAAIWGHGYYTADKKRIAFVAQVEALGKAQEEKVRLIVEQGRKDKERADRENAKLRDSNAALARSLRDSRARASYVPAPAPGAKRPEYATFDRAILERAIQHLDERVSGIVAEGDKARIDLDTAKGWANERSQN